MESIVSISRLFWVHCTCFIDSRLCSPNRDLVSLIFSIVYSLPPNNVRLMNCVVDFTNWNFAGIFAAAHLWFSCFLFLSHIRFDWVITNLISQWCSFILTNTQPCVWFFVFIFLFPCIFSLVHHYSRFCFQRPPVAHSQTGGFKQISPRHAPVWMQLTREVWFA